MKSDKTLVAEILTGSYPATPHELEPLAERIREVEGFFVDLAFKDQPADESLYSPGTYHYERAASQKTNVAKWKEKRILPRYPFLQTGIVTPQGRPLLDDELISYAHGTCLHSYDRMHFHLESGKKAIADKHSELSQFKGLISQFSLFEIL